MNTNSHPHYSPFSISARKWMIAIGAVLFLAVIAYALSQGVISYFNY